MKKDTQEVRRGAFQRGAGVNGVPGVLRTEEEHWTLCVRHPARGSREKSSRPRKRASLGAERRRSDLERFPGPQRADGNSQRGERRRSQRWFFWDVLKLARFKKKKRASDCGALRSAAR